MKACNKCGGIKATENLEIIAGTTCKCPLDVGVIVKLADIDKVIEDKMKELELKTKFNNQTELIGQINCLVII